MRGSFAASQKRDARRRKGRSVRRLTVAKLASRFRNFIMLGEIPVLPRKIPQLCQLYRNSENGTLTLERLFMRRLCPPTSTYRVEYRVVTSWNVLAPSRLVNFPSKFITRRLVLSGIA